MPWCGSTRLSFAQGLGFHTGHLRGLLFAFASVTVVIGGLMCYAEHHLKRLLAFSTVCHAGLMLLAFSVQGHAGGCRHAHLPGGARVGEVRPVFCQRHFAASAAFDQ